MNGRTQAPKSLAFIVAVIALCSSVRAAEPVNNSPSTSIPANGGLTSAGGPIDVRVVSAADCVNTPPTMKLIEATALEMGLRVDIVRQIASTQEEANQFRFFGSPTVQIDGLDLELEMRTSTRYVLS